MVVEVDVRYRGSRRLAVTVTLRPDHRLSEKHLQLLKRAAFHCPVHASLHPETEVTIDFE